MAESGFDVAACVERVRQRDEDAARELVNHLYPLVLKLVRAHRPRRMSEEDLVQTVFMKVFANLNQYSGTVPIEHWISRITINTCVNHLHAEKARPELRMADLSEEQAQVLESLATTSDDLPPSQTVAAREVVELLLAQLEPADRLLLRLLHMEGRTIAEIQQITGWNKPLIKVRAFRARQKLRKQFGQLVAEEKL
jgi:RNA polymerase sigma-70 factor (ECF subfamily)